MKRAFQVSAVLISSMAFLLCLASAPAAQAATVLKCTAANGTTPCTRTQVFYLNKNMVSARDAHQELAMVRYISMDPNGTLKCIQTNGTACTDDQLADIIAIAERVQSADGPFFIRKEVDSTSPK